MAVRLASVEREALRAEELRAPRSGEAEQLVGVPAAGELVEQLVDPFAQGLKPGEEDPVDARAHTQAEGDGERAEHGREGELYAQRVEREVVRQLGGRGGH